MNYRYGWKIAGLGLVIAIGIPTLSGAAKKPAPPAKKPAATKKPATTQKPAASTQKPAASTQKPAAATKNTGPTAAQQYKNIQVLKDLPADRMLEVMQGYNEALGVQCTFCHVEDFARDVNPHKTITRQMILLTRRINEDPSVKNAVTCFTCHRAEADPANSPAEAAKREAARKEAATHKKDAGEAE
ncbi:MAG: c-type cytochrome [Armatimonadetes bacterium]|nr:c-type cytochrome [Armatimonadota bacterium]